MERGQKNLQLGISRITNYEVHIALHKIGVERATASAETTSHEVLLALQKIGVERAAASISLTEN